MTPNAPLPDAVQWSEGMMLSPQHLQQNDRYWHAQLRHRLQTLTPSYWGVLRLRFDLVKEVLTLSELECLLPDGLLVAFPGALPYSPPAEVAIDVGAACRSGEPPVKLWCCVNPRGAHAAVQDSQERRYNSVLDDANLDENIGEQAVQLPRLQVRFHLHLGATSPSAQSAVPLLEISRADNQQLRITPYHPPMLNIEVADGLGDTSLWRGLRELNDRLWDKVVQLGEHGKLDARTDTLSNEQREHLEAARRIAACLPSFTTLLTGTTHPSQLYQALAQLVGATAGIGADPTPLLMKPYRHDDCAPQFRQAMDFVQARIDTLDTRYEQLDFKRVESYAPNQPDAIFERRLPAGMGDELLIEVEPRDGQTATQLLDWLSDALIAAADVVPKLRRARVAGATVRALDAKEIERGKLRSNALLFAIHNQPLALDDQDGLHAFGKDAVLQIIGRKSDSRPNGIVLYRSKQDAGTSPGGRHA